MVAKEASIAGGFFLSALGLFLQVKVKNRAHPAFERAVLIALSKRTGSRSR
jgi:hypothetical protein